MRGLFGKFFSISSFVRMNPDVRRSEKEPLIAISNGSENSQRIRLKTCPFGQMTLVERKAVRMACVQDDGEWDDR